LAKYNKNVKVKENGLCRTCREHAKEEDIKDIREEGIKKEATKENWRIQEGAVWTELFWLRLALACEKV
jgi:hypothetical protein